MKEMLTAGFIYGFLIGLKEHADNTVKGLKEARAREEEDGVGELRRPRRRKPSLFVLR
jgi:hypothetical protein